MVVIGKQMFVNEYYYVFKLSYLGQKAKSTTLSNKTYMVYLFDNKNLQKFTSSIIR